MKKSLRNRIGVLIVDMYDCVDFTPREILKPYIPIKIENEAWIPQTMGDQVWVMYEFHSEENRLKWEESLPENISNWLLKDRNKISRYVKQYGWGIRNENGFK